MSLQWNVSDDNYCIWEGLVCTPNYEVYSMTMKFANLTGTIPESFGNVSTLEFIALLPQDKEIFDVQLLLDHGGRVCTTCPGLSGELFVQNT